MKLKGNPYSDQRKEKEQWRDRMIDFNFGDSQVDDLQDSLSQKFAEVSNVGLTETGQEIVEVDLDADALKKMYGDGISLFLRMTTNRERIRVVGFVLGDDQNYISQFNLEDYARRRNFRRPFERNEDFYSDTSARSKGFRAYWEKDSTPDSPSE